MPSVFAGGQTLNGGFRSGLLGLSFAGTPVNGFLVQNVQFSYSQQITMLFEIGSDNVYYVGGRAQGSATLAKVAGPAAFGADFLLRFNNLCEPQDIEFSGSNTQEGNCPASQTDYLLEDAVLTTISVSVAAQDVVINEQLQFIFADLEI